MRHNASVRFVACSFRVLWTDFLQERLAQETSHPEFSQFPFRFTEIAKLLLDVYVRVVSTTNIYPDIVYSAPDDIQNSDKIRSLLKDIREARQAKSREGLQKIDHSELSVRDIIYHPLRVFTVITSCRTFVLWKSMKYGRSLCVPWARSRSLLATLQPTHENLASDFTSIVHFVLQAYMYLEEPSAAGSSSNVIVLFIDPKGD